jgi:Complex I intermediate-associated protein 30 (CIA30)
MSSIYRYLFPSSGGGWVKRYYQFKKTLILTEINTSDALMMPPLTLFDFTRTIDRADAMYISNSSTIDQWTVSDDSVIQGFSKSRAAFITSRQSWNRHLQQLSKGSAPSSGDEPLHDDELTRPYIRWYGSLNTNVGLESKAQRSGFCAIRSPLFPMDGANLQGLYRFLEIQCRYVYPSNNPFIYNKDNTSVPAERLFTLNLRVTTALNDDIYQGHLALERGDIQLDPNTTEAPFRTFIIPFDQLTLTARGREREFQRHLTDGSVSIESIGFLLMDGVHGAFVFDLARIRAVNCSDNGTVYDPQPAADKEESDSPSDKQVNPLSDNQSKNPI